MLCKSNGPKISLQDILEWIDKANGLEVNEIILSIVQKYNREFPDWEVGFISFHKNPQEGRAELEAAFESLKKRLK